jgi:small neutral amino acid transporter SnatA (MarC family)
MTEVISRVMGLILAAVAIEFIKNGIVDMIAEFMKK